MLATSEKLRSALFCAVYIAEHSKVTTNVLVKEVRVSPSTIKRCLRILRDLGVVLYWDEVQAKYTLLDWGIFDPIAVKKLLN